MANQSSANVVAALKREVTMGTAPAGGAGAERIRLLDSPGLKYNRSEVPSEERRPDLLEPMPGLGGKNVTGSYNTEVNPGGFFDMFLESILRGTMAAKAQQSGICTHTQLCKIETPAAPVNTSYSIEQRDVDVDDSELFKGVRITQLDLSMQPRQRAKCAWTLVGLDRSIVGSASSPYWTSPSATTGDSLIVDNASISYAGSPILVLTGMELSIAIANASMDLIGSLTSPDVFMNKLTVNGSLTAIRQDFTALTAFDAETEFAIKAVLVAPGTGARLTFAVNLPRVKLLDIDAPFLQGDTSKVETRKFRAAFPIGYSNTVELYTSTATLVAY